jgi:hypothetical protein
VRLNEPSSLDQRHPRGKTAAPANPMPTGIQDIQNHAMDFAARCLALAQRRERLRKASGAADNRIPGAPEKRREIGLRSCIVRPAENGEAAIR